MAVEADFNPRSPHGERLPINADTNSFVKISTHAPRTGSDNQSFLDAVRVNGFQPTLPARGATMDYVEYLTAKAISTHAPRTGSDGKPPT